MYKRALVSFLLLIIVLIGCSQSEQPVVYNSATDSGAQLVKETTGAEECYVSFKDCNSLGDSMPTIYIEIVNAKESVQQMPLWRSTSLAALEYLWHSGKKVFRDNESVEIKFTQAWDEMFIDSTRGSLIWMPTKHLLVADSMYHVITTILTDMKGKGFINSREVFDSILSDSILLFLDSTMLSLATPYGLATEMSPGGFESGMTPTGETVLTIHVLESRPSLTIEHAIIFSLDKDFIVGWHCKSFVPAQ